MRRRERREVRDGAASFYVVAFSTLILMIIATSFAAIIISEVTRTMNDDLAQSAYDSAMAGIEDAKLAYHNYRNCLEQQLDNGTVTSQCADILEIVEGEQDCDMVAKVLGRVSSDGGVDIKELGVGNNMQQAYTCVTMTDVVPDYGSTLSSSNAMRVFKAKFDGDIKANDIERVRISWFSAQDALKGKSFSNVDGGKVVFPIISGLGSKPAAAPPTISLAMIQTSDEYDLSDFDVTKNGETNRAVAFLVPTANQINGNDENNHIVAKDNVITKDQFAASNDKLARKVPFTVVCNGAEFACSAEIELPKPIGGTRNDDTFIFAVGLPYGKPDTEISLQFFGGGTASQECGDASSEEECDTDEPIKLKGVQIAVDSTGRANDLFRRVQVRLDNKQDFSLSIMGPLELLSDGSGESLAKDYKVICEYNFGAATCE